MISPPTPVPVLMLPLPSCCRIGRMNGPPMAHDGAACLSGLTLSDIARNAPLGENQLSLRKRRPLEVRSSYSSLAA